MRLLFLILLTLLPLRAMAQDAALLVADQLYITRERELVASGNVEAFQNGVRLRASSIRYDQGTGALSIEGPITLTEGDGTVITATAAELDAGLRNGILKGARLVLNQQLQLAAVQIDRVDGRYNQLYKTAVTSCRICDDGSAPLWQIRAKRVIYDELEEQLYFDEAQFRIGRIPVFYIPRLRLPGPTVERASGFLVPSIRSTSALGIGLKIPYFIKLSDKRDLTLTPYLRENAMELNASFTLSSDPRIDRGQNRSAGLLAKWRQDFAPGRTRLIAGLDLAEAAWKISGEHFDWEAGMDWYIVHQVSSVHTRLLCERLGIDHNRAPQTFPTNGNVGPAAIPMTLAKVSDKIAPGDRVLLMGIGSGLNTSYTEIVW